MHRKRIVVAIGVTVAALAITGAGAAYASGRDGDACGSPTQLTRAAGPNGTAGTEADQTSTNGPACVPAAPAVPAR